MSTNGIFSKAIQLINGCKELNYDKMVNGELVDMTAEEISK